MTRRERPILAGGLEASLPQVLGPSLQIGQRDPGERLFHERQEAGGIGGVGAPGVRAGLHGKPEFDQFGVLGAVVGGSEAGRRHHGELVHGRSRIARYV